MERRRTVFEELGSDGDRCGGVDRAVPPTSASFAGQSVRILVEASDAGGGSLVEAGVDNVTIIRQ